MLRISTKNLGVMRLAKRIKWLVMDVDGTLTDGRIIFGSDGTEYKCFNVRDGYGIHDLLPRAGITPVIITGRVSSVVERRCQELGIEHVLQGETNKTEAVLKIVPSDELGSVAYIGDDINDYDAMQLVKQQGGLISCPANADERIKTIVEHITQSRSGDGAVRELIEWIMAKQFQQTIVR